MGGDSEAYWHGQAEPLKPGPRVDAAAFDSFDAPAEVLDRWDQADRAVEWTPRGKGVGVVHRSTAPLLSVEDCTWAIDTTEAHALANGGWTTGRHVEAPTTDVPVSQVPALREWFNGVLKESRLPPPRCGTLDPTLAATLAPTLAPTLTLILSLTLAATLNTNPLPRPRPPPQP